MRPGFESTNTRPMFYDQEASEREEVQTLLASLNAQLKELETKANSLPNTADNQKIQESVKVATAATVDLQRKNQDILDRSKSVTDTLERIRAKTSFTRP